MVWFGLDWFGIWEVEFVWSGGVGFEEGVELSGVWFLCCWEGFLVSRL